MIKNCNDKYKDLYKSNSDESILENVSEKIKDTHREKASSNKTPMLLKSMNMEI